MNGKMITTRCARRDTRVVGGGDRHLRRLKRDGRRRERRVNKDLLRRDGEDYEPVTVQVTGYDVC